MTDVVLDSSVVLAVLQGEAGGDSARRRIGALACSMSSVNYAEVAGKLSNNGFSPPEIREFIRELSIEILPFAEHHALIAGQLRPATRERGLSLGDRACLAHARELDVPAITMDRAWRDVSVGVKIEVISR